MGSHIADANPHVDNVIYFIFFSIFVFSCQQHKYRHYWESLIKSLIRWESICALLWSIIDLIDEHTYLPQNPRNLWVFILHIMNLIYLFLTIIHIIMFSLLQGDLHFFMHRSKKMYYNVFDYHDHDEKHSLHKKYQFLLGNCR